MGWGEACEKDEKTAFKSVWRWVSKRLCEMLNTALKTGAGFYAKEGGRKELSWRTLRRGGKSRSVKFAAYILLYQYFFVYLQTG